MYVHVSILYSLSKNPKWQYVKERRIYKTVVCYASIKYQPYFLIVL